MYQTYSSLPPLLLDGQDQPYQSYVSAVSLVVLWLELPKMISGVCQISAKIPFVVSPSRTFFPLQFEIL